MVLPKRIKIALRFSSKYLADVRFFDIINSSLTSRHLSEENGRILGKFAQVCVLVLPMRCLSWEKSTTFVALTYPPGIIAGEFFGRR